MGLTDLKMDWIWCVIEREGSRVIPKLVGLNKWKMGVLCIDMRKATEAIHLDGEHRKSTLGT